MGAFLKRIWILCLICAVIYYVFAGQDHTFWVEIILVALGVAAWFYGRSIDKKKKAGKTR